MLSYDLYENCNINRILLLLAGLWPFNQSKLTQVQIIMCLSIIASFTIFQLTALLTSECTPDFVITVFSNALASFCTFLIYSSFVVNNRAMKYLLEQLQQICNNITDKNEIAIIKSYGINAKRFTTGLILSGAVFLVVIQLIWLHVFDIFLPENESTGHRLQFMVTEYFFDQEKYFYLIILHMNATIFVSSLGVIATGTMFLTYLLHVCGMFKIAYRIIVSIQVNVQYNINVEDVIMIYKKIVYAINIHRKAMMICTLMMKEFEGIYCIIIVILVCGMSLNLYRIFQIISFENDRAKIFIHFGYVISILIYLFLGNYTAQQITDHNNDVYAAIYNTRWYVAPLHIQKLVLLLLQRGNKPFYLTIGKVFVASLEGFATLTSSSMSYFTVMYSVQQ
ncbi:uncharacterized protein LOC116851987 [Odontomachus brunneus]|uniref:uncharacterized protein LOC116851987 n=1 Tax=Odontomachus brunneus TaxID=486640 RepID=UPI0013F19611|nr:uncharacterized protein LOC116851987 [Odontomachus brunneus]